jgi:hypothetical protein
MTPPKQADELLKALDQHIGQMSPHIRERRTAQLLIDARDALRARLSSPSVPEGWHLVPEHANYEMRNILKHCGPGTPDGYWADLLAVAPQPPSAPPEAGKVQDLQSESGIEQLSGYDPWDVGGDDESEPHGPDIEVAHGKECMGCGLVALRDHYESRHPSPVAQGAGVEWISVKERLPELVHVENKETIFLGRILTIERMSDRVIVSLDDQDFSADMLVHIGGHEFPIWRRHGDRVKFWKPGPPKPTAPDGGGL